MWARASSGRQRKRSRKRTRRARGDVRMWKVMLFQVMMLFQVIMCQGIKIVKIERAIPAASSIPAERYRRAIPAA
jgi:hypothetical protein